MPDYMFLLESRLSPEQRATVVRVQELAAAMNANVYLVGGAVRDLISGMPIRDLDFVMEGNPFRVARELEKGGARILLEDERLRHVELIFAGDADGSLAATRDEVYRRPGTRPEIRWSTIMEDLRRRDFSLNAIALSLNPASRGLLLDPTNGLADLEKHEVRALSIHSFTNQPVRLLRARRYCARMGSKMESRTAEWFALAIERGLHENIPPEDVGREVQQLAREEKPTAILKAWEAHGLIGAIHPQLARRHPHYEALQRLMRVRDSMVAAAYRPRLFAPMTHALLARLKPRERSRALARMAFPSAQREAVLVLEAEAKKVAKALTSRKTASPRDAFEFLEKVPLDVLAYLQAEISNAKALGKVRSYLRKWRPLSQALPSAAAELEALGLPRGPKFEKVLEDLFQQQLQGKARKPEERTRLLRRLAGIKEPPKKKPKEEKKKAVAKALQKPAKKKSAEAPIPESGRAATGRPQGGEPAGAAAAAEAAVVADKAPPHVTGEAKTPAPAPKAAPAAEPKAKKEARVRTTAKVGPRSGSKRAAPKPRASRRPKAHAKKRGKRR